MTERLADNRPVLLDLFCGVGLAADGYSSSGFRVVGVDVVEQPDYPYEFHRADAMTFPLAGFDAVHASPPCQAYSTMGNRFRDTNEHPDLLLATLERLRALHVPWVVENVCGAAKIATGWIKLDGSMFGLGVSRPRLFWSNVLLMMPPRAAHVATCGVYGRRPDGRRLVTGRDFRAASSVEQGREAMGVTRAVPWYGLTQGIPPAYAEYIGARLLEVVESEASSNARLVNASSRTYWPERDVR